MSSNPDQMQNVHDTPLPEPCSDLDDSACQETIQGCYRRIKNTSGKWPWEWLSQNYRPRPNDWTCDDAVAMAKVVEHACNSYRDVWITQLSVFFQRTGKFDDETRTWTSSDVPIHCEEAKAFITFMKDRMINQSPTFGGERVTTLSGSQDTESSGQAESTSRKRKRHQNTPSTPNHKISQDGVVPKGSVDSDTNISEAPLKHPLQSMDPHFIEIEDRIKDILRDLETHESSKKRALRKIAFNSLEFHQNIAKLAQKERDTAFKRKEALFAKLSSAKKQGINCEQDEVDTLVVLEDMCKAADIQSRLVATIAQHKEEHLQRIEKRVRDLRADLEKDEKHIELCQEKIENEGYPAQVVILRQNLNRLCAANLVELSPKEINELKEVVKRFFGEKDKEGWA